MYDQKYHINRPKKRRSGYVRFNRRHLLFLIWASLPHPMGCGIVCWYFLTWVPLSNIRARVGLNCNLTLIIKSNYDFWTPIFRWRYCRLNHEKMYFKLKFFTCRHIWAYSSVIICTVQQKLFEKIICSVLDTNPDRQIHGPTLWPLYHEMMSNSAASKQMYQFYVLPCE